MGQMGAQMSPFGHLKLKGANLGGQMGQFGAQMGQLGAKMGQLGAEMGKVGFK